MIIQFRVQVGFFLEPIYHTITVEIPKLRHSSYNKQFKTNKYVKGKYKSIRQSRNSTF